MWKLTATNLKYIPWKLRKYLLKNIRCQPVLDDEVQEAKNKDFKFVREHRNRKDSEEYTNKDIFHYFLLSPEVRINLFYLPL